MTWKDIDFQQRTVNIKPEKGSNPRILRLSEKALAMIGNLPRNKDRLFSNAEDMRSSFFMQRRRIARKLSDSNILKIHFHSFRVWKGTHEYHRTRDLIYVQGILGHKNIEVTRHYVVIEQALYQADADDGFTTRVAATQKEILELLDSGFDYIMQKDGLAYLRKRK